MLTKNDKENIRKGCHYISNIISLISGNYQLLEATEPALKENSRFAELGISIKMLTDTMADINFYRYSDYIDSVPVKTVDFVEGLLENVGTRPHTSSLNISVEAFSEIPDICADKVKIQFVINSIMDNIADCTPAGNVSVKITYDDSYVNISITDSIEEFDPEILSRLFEPFNTFKPDHAGLSLSSSKRIMRALDGDLTRSSAQGCGSTFTLSFPRIS